MAKGPSSQQKELRVVLLGKTGAGKSSLGNTLLGRDAFRVARGLSSGTERCQWADAEKHGTILQVTDTPGLCDTHRDEEDVLKEVGKSVVVALPGPHVIVIVLRCDRRFTEEEYQAYVTLKALFGDGICKFMIVVFAGADAYGDTPEEQEQALSEGRDQWPAQLQEVLNDADNRYFPVNNRGSRGDREKQANVLLEAMKALVLANKGQHFTSDLIDEMDRLREPLVEKRMKNNTSRQTATRETNEAILKEEESPSFFSKMKEVIKDKVVPLLVQVGANIAVGVAFKAVSNKCSLM